MNQPQRAAAWRWMWLTGVAASPAIAQATFQTLGDLPGGFDLAEVRAVSDDGRVAVGWSSTSFGIYMVVAEAFCWTEAAGITGIRSNDVDYTYANAASADGSVVVGNVSFSGSTFNPFRWTAASGIVALGDLPGGSVDALGLGVSADGSVVTGRGRSALGDEAFRWTAATGMVALGDLPGGIFYSTPAGISADGSVIAGWSSAGDGARPFRWTAAMGMVSLGARAGGESEGSYATGISVDGRVIIGYGGGSGPGGEAWRWTVETGIVGLGDLPGGLYAGQAKGVSGDGSVIVGNSNIGFGNVAFIWDAQHGMRDLRRVLIDEYGLGAALQDVLLTDAVDISADGRVIVGVGSTGEPGGSWIVRLPQFPSCYPNCDQSTTAPALNISDFTCFINRFAGGDSYANCDSSTVLPVMNIADFTCFLNAFAGGCS